MLQNFRNLKEVLQKFTDDAVCRHWLESQRWDGVPVCAHCGHQGAYKLGDGKTYKCSSKECHKKFTVTKGTVFENTNIPLNTWFAAVYLATAHKKGISSLQLSRDLGITQKTAWFMLHRIRKAFTVNAPEMLENLVEMDETYIGGKAANKTNKQRKKLKEGTGYINKTPVFGILERNGNVIVQPVTEAKGETLMPIITQRVSADAICVTDGFGGYKDLKNSFKAHEIINHAQNEYSRGIYHTNTIEGFWSLLKRGIYGIYHQVSPKHLHRYCDEFAYRYNSRKLPDNERFSLSLKHIDGRLTYKKLIGKE